MQRALKKPGYKLSVNLENQTLYDSQGIEETFEIDPNVRERLLRGLDDIGMTMERQDAISKFEKGRPSYLEPAIA